MIELREIFDHFYFRQSQAKSMYLCGIYAQFMLNLFFKLFINKSFRFRPEEGTIFSET
jgi:hypothetical protein